MQRSPEEQRAWEERAGKVAAAFAALSALFVIAAFAWRIAALPRSPEKEAEFLSQLAANKGDFLIAVVLGAISIALLPPVLLYLYRVTRFRREQILPAAAIFAVAGPLVLAVVQVLLHLDRVDTAEQFLASGPRTDARAEDMLREGVGAYVGFGYGGNIALGFALVVIALNAMRAGVLSRFMGVLGIILGALYVLPLGPTPLIQVFWLGSLAALFLGQWPGGRGPAWEAMAELPWPTAAQIAAHRRGEEEEEGPLVPDLEPTPAPAPAAKSAKPGAQRSRKRKKRR